MPTTTSRSTACSTPKERTDERRPAQALRDHAGRRLVARQQDRLVAYGAPGLSRPPAPVQQPVPGRREHPELAQPGRGEEVRSRLAQDHGREPLPGGHGARLLSHVRKRVQPRQGGSPRRHQLGRALPGRPGAEARLGGAARQADRQEGDGPRCRPRWPRRGVSPGPPRARRHRLRSQPESRRHDSLRHSQVPHAAREAQRRDRPHPGHGRRDQAELPGRRRDEDDEERWLRRLLPRRGPARRPQDRHPAEGQAARPRCRHGPACGRARRAGRAVRPGRGLRRWQHRNRRRTFGDPPGRARSHGRRFRSARADAGPPRRDHARASTRA